MELARIDEALTVLSNAYREWQPSWIFLLYSGGYDSVCSTDIGWQWAKDAGFEHRVKVISLDTGVAADGWREYVKRVAHSEGWRHEIWDNPDPDFFYNNAQEYGFPYTREMHALFIYRNLKERTLDKVRAKHKQGRQDRCMLVTGMRRDESAQRAKTPEQLKDGSALWVSPLVTWNGDDVMSHRIVRDFEDNPFYETVGGSGDCECNWGQFVSLDKLARYSPKLAERIRPIHEECLKRFGYGYGERPSKSLLAERAGQMLLPGIEPIVNLCATCSRAKADASKAIEWRDLQNW